MTEFRVVGHRSIGAHAGSACLLRADFSCFPPPEVL
jgi:hypothetical protein